MNDPKTAEPGLLEVVNLFKRYGELTAVNGVNFQVRRGEILGLLGPNGAGKTSILEIVEGLRHADGGHVRLFDDPAGARNARLRARIGVQLQASAMLPNLTARELVALQASFYPHPLTPADVLAQVALQGKEHALSSSLSGGQLQRLALGLALVGDPELVLLDEPTTGLDPAARREVWAILQRLRADRRSILITTHYMEEAEVLCDRVAILDHGQMVAIGTVAELAERLGGDRIVFAAEDTADGATLSKLPSVSQVLARNGTTTLITADAGQTLSAIVERARGRELPRDLAVRRPTLEEIYLELTGAALPAADAA